MDTCSNNTAKPANSDGDAKLQPDAKRRCKVQQQRCSKSLCASCAACPVMHVPGARHLLAPASAAAAACRTVAACAACHGRQLLRLTFAALLAKSTTRPNTMLVVNSPPPSGSASAMPTAALPPCSTAEDTQNNEPAYTGNNTHCSCVMQT